MNVYTAHVVTESADHYVWVFKNEPTREQVVEKLMQYEGADPESDRNFYMNTTSVKIEFQEVIDL